MDWQTVMFTLFQQAKTIAEQLAEKLNAKLNYQPKGDEDKEDEEVETFKKYEEELEINDFPQQARWKVTSKVSDEPANYLSCRLVYHIYRLFSSTGGIGSDQRIFGSWHHCPWDLLSDKQGAERWRS